ncbi:MAG TPA: hypothetical protein VN862_01910 [Candidatus Acidoferrales bacterium]|nr:hypothetical protein [Candidatus Acidoferrales bacterium]
MPLKMRPFFTLCLAAATLLAGAFWQTSSNTSAANAQVETLADEYVSLRVQYDPTLAGDSGLPYPVAFHFPDRSAAALRRLHDGEDAFSHDFRRFLFRQLKGRGRPTPCFAKN